VERNFSIFSWVKQTSNIQNQTKNKRKTSGFGAGGRIIKGDGKSVHMHVTKGKEKNLKLV